MKPETQPSGADPLGQGAHEGVGPGVLLEAWNNCVYSSVGGGVPSALFDE